jgi:hypothetical protein
MYFTKNAHRALAELTIATADYESAWRESTQHVEVSRDRVNQEMRDAENRKEMARRTLIAEEVPVSVMNAIEAALIIAAARPTGERQSIHRRGSSFSSVDSALSFIEEMIYGERVLDDVE